MRVIEQQMLNAIQEKRSWSKGNTRIDYLCELTTPTIARIEYAKVYLHNHHIASYVYSIKEAHANRETLSNWPTNTTKSRLRALGVDVYTKKHVTYLNGEPV